MLKLKPFIRFHEKKWQEECEKTLDLLKNQHINCYQIVTNKRHIQRKRVICVSLEEEKKRETEKKTVIFFMGK